MLDFRRFDYITATDFFYVIAITCIFLGLVYFFLRFAKPYVLNQIVKKEKGNIHVDEIRYVPNIGHICIITIKQQQFVTISSKTGTSIAPLIDMYHANKVGAISENIYLGREPS